MKMMAWTLHVPDRMDNLHVKLRHEFEKRDA